MDRCPPELFHRCISELTCREKQNSYLVSRRWNQEIRSSFHCEHLIIENEQNFKDSKVYFEENKWEAAKVQCLCLKQPELDACEVLEIPKQFPNMQEFEWVQNGSLNNSLIYNEEDAQYWKNITSFREVNSFCLSVEILENDGFCNLTKLDVTFTHDANCVVLVKVLSKAPGLKKLTLSSTKMSLLDLKWLYCQTLKLDTLYLDMITLIEIDEDEQEVEVPSLARGLTDFRMQILKIGDSYEFLRSCMAFIAGNYKDLKHLTISGERVPETPQDYETELIDIVGQCPPLESYNVNIFPIKRSILEAMETSGIQLKKLNIYTGSILQQIEYCVQSAQSNFLESMTINVDSQKEIDHCLEGLPRLKHLEIICKANPDASQEQSTTVELENWNPRSASSNDLMMLETLKLENWNLQLGPAATVDNFQTNLKTLMLKNVHITNTNGDVMSFILKACPGLTKISIQGKIIDNEQWKVDFSNHSCTCIELNIAANDHYKVDNQRYVRWYRFNGKTLEEYFLADSKEPSHISIMYKSDTTLKIGKAYIPNF